MKPGEICKAVIPILPTSTPEQNMEVGGEVYDALHRACAEHGLTATDIRSVWGGTATEFRTSKHAAGFEELLDTMESAGVHVFVYEATAA